MIEHNNIIILCSLLLIIYAALAVGLNSGNIVLLVLSILMWVLSIILTVIAAVALKKEKPCKHRSLLNFQILPSWLKIICIVLLAIEDVLLLIVLLLWVAFSEIANS